MPARFQQSFNLIHIRQQRLVLLIQSLVCGPCGRVEFDVLCAHKYPFLNWSGVGTITRISQFHESLLPRVLEFPGPLAHPVECVVSGLSRAAPQLSCITAGATSLIATTRL